jgi:hypothetical protein
MNEFYATSLGRPIESVLLYTDEDIELAQYIRYNFFALDKMTGHHLNIYTIEQPTQVKGVLAHKYWKALLEQATYSFLHLMGWTRYKPYDKTQVYQIANILGMYPDVLPCIVLFGDLKSDEKIVVTITEEIPQFFRRLSSVVLATIERLIESKLELHDNLEEIIESYKKSYKIMEKTGNIGRPLEFDEEELKSNEHLKERLKFLIDLTNSFYKLPDINYDFGDFKKRFLEIWSAMQEEINERKDEVSVFNFKDKTVFINKPIGKVEIKDFQDG